MAQGLETRRDEVSAEQPRRAHRWYQAGTRGDGSTTPQSPSTGRQQLSSNTQSTTIHHKRKRMEGDIAGHAATGPCIRVAKTQRCAPQGRESSSSAQVTLLTNHPAVYSLRNKLHETDGGGVSPC